MHRISFYEFRSAFGNTSLESGGEARRALGTIFKNLATSAKTRGDIVADAAAFAGFRIKATPDSAQRNLAAGTGDEEVAWAFYYWLHCKLPGSDGLDDVDKKLLGEPFERFTGYPVSAGELRALRLAFFGKAWPLLVSSPRLVWTGAIVSTSICLLIFGALYFATDHREPDLTNARHLSGPAGETGDAENVDAKLDAILRAVESDRGVPYGALKSAVQKFGGEDISIDELPKKLGEWADRYVELERIVQEWIGDGPELVTLRNTAAVKLDIGDLEGAQTALEQAIRTLQNIQKGSIRKEAELTAQRADILSLRFLYLEAASEFARAAELTERAGESSIQYTSRQAWNLTRAIETTSGLLAAEKAAPLLEALIAETDKSTDYSTWVDLNIHLARIYHRSSEHRLDSDWSEKELAILDMLDKEVAIDNIYRDTIDVDLANASLRIGYEKGDIQLIKRAVSTYERIATRSKTSGDTLNWGFMTHNKAEALGYIAGITGSVDDQRAAIAAWRASLQGITAAEAPDDHWTTVGYLVSALVALHVQFGDQAALVEAEKLAEERVAYSAIHRDKDPLSWAVASRDLGELYLTKAQDIPTVESFTAALGQFEFALTALSEEVSPSLWIDVNYQAGTAAHQIAAFDDPSKNLHIALTHLLAAREVLSKRVEENDTRTEKVKWGLAVTYAELGQVTSDINYLNRAFENFNELISRVNGDDIETMIILQGHAADLRLQIANITRSKPDFDKSIELYREVENLALKAGKDEIVSSSREAITEIEKARLNVIASPSQMK